MSGRSPAGAVRTPAATRPACSHLPWVRHTNAAAAGGRHQVVVPETKLGQQRHNGAGVELRTSDPKQLASRLRTRACGTVGASGDDRVEGVAGRDQTRRERYSLADEPVGVATPVPALVGGAHRGGEVGEGGDAANQVAPDGGVAAHEDPLGISQRPGLEQDLGGHGDLAEVVQKRRVAHVARHARE